MYSQFWLRRNWLSEVSLSSLIPDFKYHALDK